MQENGGLIEDWELSGDLREIERRKAEKKKAKLPVEVRKPQLVQEWQEAKAMAAKAKAAGDKVCQKNAGMLIRDLKLELKALGTYEINAYPARCSVEGR